MAKPSSLSTAPTVPTVETAHLGGGSFVIGKDGSVGPNLDDDVMAAREQASAASEANPEPADPEPTIVTEETES